MDEEQRKEAAMETLGEQLFRWVHMDDAQLGRQLKAYIAEIEDGQFTTFDPYSAEEVEGITTFLREGADLRVS